MRERAVRQQKLDKALEPILREGEARHRRAEAIRKRGGNAYRVIEAWCANSETGKVDTDIVIDAVGRLKTPKEMRSFFLGFVKDIRRNPHKHPKEAQRSPRAYARADIMYALGYFSSAALHKRWEKVISAHSDQWVALLSFE
ncbi:MAG: hypothetical protein HZA25_00070 [Candidatus Niyogibacteria bacterium]|nr:hypothetical protein [Candidatus Niyogibacteria bacterium]